MLETLRPILRAAAIAAFTVGTLLWLLNPPSLSGAGGLLAIVVGALALLLLGAWVTVAMIGGESMSEAEVERLAPRSEGLARRPPPDRAPTEIDEPGADAIARLPQAVQHVPPTRPI